MSHNLSSPVLMQKWCPEKAQVSTKIVPGKTFKRKFLIVLDIWWREREFSVAFLWMNSTSNLSSCLMSVVGQKCLMAALINLQYPTIQNFKIWDGVFRSFHVKLYVLSRMFQVGCRFSLTCFASSIYFSWQALKFYFICKQFCLSRTRCFLLSQ